MRAARLQSLRSAIDELVERSYEASATAAKDGEGFAADLKVAALKAKVMYLIEIHANAAVGDFRRAVEAEEA